VQTVFFSPCKPDATHLQLNIWQHLRDALPVLIHHFDPEPCATLGLEVVVNEVLALQVALADAAGVVLTQPTCSITTARAPAEDSTRTTKQQP
jgi:hypothetical protein